MRTTLCIMGLIFLSGGLGSLVNAFLGDSGWHLPMKDKDTGIYRPGWIGNVLVGGLAATASWGMTSSLAIGGSGALDLSGLKVAVLSNAVIVGFGGASWFKSYGEKSTLQKAAALAAMKLPDHGAAAAIATATPNDALKIAQSMTAQ